MRRHSIIIIIGLFIAIHGTNSQITPKQLSAFSGDSIAYFRYNFLENQEVMIRNTTLKTFFERMEVPIKSFELRHKDNLLVSIYFYTETVDVINRLKPLNEASPYMFFATSDWLRDKVNITSVITQIPNYENKKLLPWNNSYKELFGNFKIESIGYCFPDIEKWK